MPERDGSPGDEIIESRTERSARITRAARKGELRRIHGRLYTSNLGEPLEQVVRRNRWAVVAPLFPDSVVSHRSALTRWIPLEKRGGGEEGESLILSGGYDRIVTLPGLRIRQIAGPGPLPGDLLLTGSLYLASPQRALLECLGFRRVRGPSSPTLPRPLLRKVLSGILLETPAEEFLGSAELLARELGREREWGELRVLVEGRSAGGASTLAPGAELPLFPPPPTPVEPVSPPETASPRSEGSRPASPPPLLTRMEGLRRALARWKEHSQPDLDRGDPEWSWLALVDSWSSCALAGWRVPLEEAEAGLLRGRWPSNQGAETRRVLRESWSLLSNPAEMSTSARHRPAEGFVRRLYHHHGRIFGRPEAPIPSETFRTLLEGFELYRTLGGPLQRGTFLLAFLEELSPFGAETGILARAALNAELISEGERRVLFLPESDPSYLPHLEEIREGGDPAPLLRLMGELHSRSPDRIRASLRAGPGGERGGSARTPPRWWPRGLWPFG